MRTILVVLVLGACGGGPADDEPTRGMWRVDLAGSAAGVAIADVGFVDVPLSHDPVPPLGAQYMVVASAGADVRAAVPIAFPAQAIAEAGGAASGFGASPTAVALTDSVASVYLSADPDIDRIDVLDATQVVRATATALPRSAPRARSTYLRGHVRVLGADDLSALPGALRAGVFTSYAATEAIDDATPDMIATLDADLGLLAPGVLDAVQTVAVVKLTNGGHDPSSGTDVLGVAYGSAFVVNERQFTEGWGAEQLKTVMVHEAAHSYQFLLDGADNSSFGDWPADVRARALAVRDRYALGIGLSAFLSSLQASGVMAGIAGNYTGDGWLAVGDGDAVRAGFATGYGSTNPAEDIAEIVASIQYPNGMARNRAFCPALRAFGPQLEDKDAMPYAKAKLLAALGFVDDVRLDGCFAGITVAAGPGVHLGVSDAGDQLAFASGSVSIVDDNGPHLVATATGAGGYIATLHFAAGVANGVGLHRLDATHAMPNPDGNKVEITGPMSGDHRISGSGLAIVTAADASHAEGLIFFLEADNDFDFPTDVFAFSTFQLP